MGLSLGPWVLKGFWALCGATVPPGTMVYGLGDWSLHNWLSLPHSSIVYIYIYIYIHTCTYVNRNSVACCQGNCLHKQIPIVK